MTKRIIALLIVLMVACVVIYPDTLISNTVTLTSTPQRVTTSSTLASSVWFQMQPGSTSTGYVLFANPAVTCSLSTTTQIVATLAPGTATAPGDGYSYPTATPNGGQTVAPNWFCVAGTSPDTMIVSYSAR
jgi:hypothetical protein